MCWSTVPREPDEMTGREEGSDQIGLIQSVFMMWLTTNGFDILLPLEPDEDETQFVSRISCINWHCIWSDLCFSLWFLPIPRLLSEFMTGLNRGKYLLTGGEKGAIVHSWLMVMMAHFRNKIYEVSKLQTQTVSALRSLLIALNREIRQEGKWWQITW